MEKRPIKEIERSNEPDFLELALLNETGNQSGKIIAKELFNNKEIEQKTRLGVGEINISNRGYLFSEYFETKILPKSSALLKRYYKGIINLRPSLDGLSREEFVKLFQSEVESVTAMELKSQGMKK